MNTHRHPGTVAYNNTGRVALVTGGCQGIGLAICQAFANSGALVVCADINEQAAASLPPEIAYRRMDTSREEDCRQVVEWTVERFGGLDILVNNASIQPADSYAPLDKTSTALWQRMLDVNLSGYTYMAQHAVRQMKTQQSGVIINLGSGQGHRTTRGVPAYGPIKAANIFQAMQWGVEYARDGIRVASVSPGAIDTPMVRATLEAQGGEGPLANRHPIGRIGRAEEVANAVLWLASDDASFVTATDLEVDGGLGAFGAFADPFPMPK